MARLSVKARPSFAGHRRTAFTLLEVLIATAVTLLMMISLAQIFKVIGDSMQQGRAALELNNRLRSVALRIRTDLNNATAIPDPPIDPASGTGYFKYYDGGMTDYTAGLYSTTLPTTDFSRFGDLDDALMYTARAGDVWFTGKVPLFVLQGVAPSTTNTALVTIAAQHAEIIAFVEPVVAAAGNPSRLPAPLIADPADGYEKARTTDLPSGFTDLPAEYRLHYRNLLIRPDLNLPTGVLPNGTVSFASGNVSYLTAAPVAGLPSPTCDMVNAHQQCDLSIRRVDPAAATSTVAANSLEDLANPANRFAHAQIPLPNGTTSLPLLGLSPPIAIPALTSDAGSPTIGTNPVPLTFQAGFLHPAFTLFSPGTADEPFRNRIGEDILASNVLAFDVKGFDPGVPLLATVGGDGFAGIANTDDDLDGNTDNASELGWAGSDDLILSPNDPGYATALTTGGVLAGTGEYVDLAWARKMQNHGFTPTTAMNLWSQLSGFSEVNFSGTSGSFPFTNSMYQSGQAYQQVSPNSILVFQPAYDTWYARYEGDGLLQSEALGYRGTSWITSTTTSLSPAQAWRATNGIIFDAATDGIDNNGGGVDDVSELETSAPFPTRLRGVKVSVRMLDPATRQIKQMSVSKEFVTQ